MHLFLGGELRSQDSLAEFADRAVAESARLTAVQVNAGVGAKVLALDAAMPAAAPAPAITEVAESGELGRSEGDKSTPAEARKSAPAEARKSAPAAGRKSTGAKK